MAHKTINTEQGHWILANMGKRVLRPGGKALTLKLIEGLQIDHDDAVVEFAPGMGYTASYILKKNPASYTGIELNEEAANKLKARLHGKNHKIFNTNAAKTGLEEGSTDKVIGEAMLTMQADHRKSEIIAEAYRILKKGGRYGIHELGLRPDTMDVATKDNVQRQLAEVIKVNARPLTLEEWSSLLVREGFTIKVAWTSPMHLLEPARILEDEGFFRALKIGWNVLTHPKTKRRIMQMRSIFKTNENQMTAFAIIAEK